MSLDCEDGIDEARWERLCAEPIVTPTPTTSALISESLRAVLDAHGFVICRHPDTAYPLDDARLSALLREAGNNAAHVVLLHEEMSK